MTNLIGAILLHPTFLSLLPRHLSDALFGHACLETRMDIGLQAMWRECHKLRRDRQRLNANVLISNHNYGRTGIDIIVDLRPNFDQQLCKCFSFKPFDPNGNLS